MQSLYTDNPDLVTMVAPSGGVTADVPVMIGAVCVIPSADAAVGELFSGYTRGVFRLPKNVGTSFTAGQLVEWDVDGEELITAAAVQDDIEIGHVLIAAGTSDTHAVILKSSATPAVNP